MSKKTKRLIQVVVGILFAAVFLYLAVRKINPDEFRIQLKSVNLRYFIPILITITVFFWLKAIRWSWLLRPIRYFSARDVFPALMIGFMGNNVLPAHLGEFARMYVLAKQYHLSKASVLSTIILERVLDFLAIIGLFAVTLQFVPLSEELELIRTGGYLIGIVCVIVFIFFMTYVWQTDRALKITEKTLLIVPRKVREKVLEMMRLGLKGIYSLRNPWLLVAIMAITVIHWGVNGLGLYLAVVSFPLQNPLSLVAIIFLMAVTILGITLPSAPGYFGTTQYCFVIALGVFGISRETALAGSFYALFMVYVPVTLAGFYFLARVGLKLSALSQEAEGIKDERLESRNAKPE